MALDPEELNKRRIARAQQRKQHMDGCNLTAVHPLCLRHCVTEDSCRCRRKALPQR